MQINPIVGRYTNPFQSHGCYRTNVQPIGTTCAGDQCESCSSEDAQGPCPGSSLNNEAAIGFGRCHFVCSKGGQGKFYMFLWFICICIYIYIYSRYSRNRFEWLKGSTLLFHSYQSNINHCRKIKAGGASSTRNIQPFGWWKSPGTSFKCMLGHWDHWDTNKKVMYVNPSFLWNFGYNKGLVTKFMLVFENKQPWILDGFPFLHLGVRWLPMQMMSLGSGKMVPGEMGKDRPWEFSKKPRRYTWSLRLNLKMRHWKRIFLLQVIIFSFQINFWRCKATLDLKN